MAYFSTVSLIFSWVISMQGMGSRPFSLARAYSFSVIREEELKITARMNDQESIKNLVAGGLGISILSERAARNFVDEKRVLAFLLPKDTAQRYLYIVYRKKYIPRPYIQAFVDQLKRRYAVALNG